MESHPYAELQNAVIEYINGMRTAPDLKAVLAPYGIYQQKNNLFMLRIRLTGGSVNLERFSAIPEIVKNFAGYGHLSSRQALQIHDVKAESILDALCALLSAGLPFRGGGGNTFRNIMVSNMSGCSPDSVFDVHPHAWALKEAVFLWDKAFALPRKLKIGIFSQPGEEHLALVQDLGFLACKQDGMRGFSVFGGGGLGRGSAAGIKLLDFIPENRINVVTRAMTDLFFDHGDRTNRSKARLRFLVEKLGGEAFRSLFLSYYQNCKLPPLSITEPESSVPRVFQNEPVTDPDAFRNWKITAVTPGAEDGLCTVRLFIPRGNLSAADCGQIADLIRTLGIERIQLTTEQDILLPNVSESALPFIWSTLRVKTEDWILRSFKGHLVSCIGSTVCKIGVLDSAELAERIAGELDAFFHDKPEMKAKLARSIIAMTRISGCPSSCSTHPTAKVGFHGLVRIVEGERQNVWQPFFKSGDEVLSSSSEPIPDIEVPAEACKRILTLLGC